MGAEMACNVASNPPDTNAICAYDIIGTPDLDVTALRLGEEQTGRKAIREAFQSISHPATCANEPA
jgi:hypothetical protein